VEVSRVIAGRIDLAQEARIKLARLLAAKGFNEVVPYPDIDNKAKEREASYPQWEIPLPTTKAVGYSVLVFLNLRAIFLTLPC
jgi:phenylalanyl-tRNA synthetase beta subunit